MDLTTLIATDWHTNNQQGVCRALTSAYRDVNALCDGERHPFFSTPNRVFGVGYNRWLVVDYWMAKACELGWLTGIRPVWVNHPKSTGPIHTLELHGRHTRLSMLHLQAPDALARDSKLRYERRVDNERCPYLLGWDEAAIAATNPGVVNLVLVHGDKEPEFAFLRVYNNPDDLNSYRDVTGNLFAGGAPITRIDDEEIPDVRIDLLPPDDADEQDEDGERGSAGR